MNGRTHQRLNLGEGQIDRADVGMIRQAIQQPRQALWRRGVYVDSLEQIVAVVNMPDAIVGEIDRREDEGGEDAGKDSANRYKRSRTPRGQRAAQQRQIYRGVCGQPRQSREPDQQNGQQPGDQQPRPVRERRRYKDEGEGRDERRGNQKAYSVAPSSCRACAASSSFGALPCQPG